MLVMIEIVSVMTVLGMLLGFVGAGGSGFIIAILTVVFGYSIHTALGTALAAMFFSSLSGTISHYREGNMRMKTGAVVGLAGAAGAAISASWSTFIPAEQLGWMTASMLIISGIALWIRLAIVRKNVDNTDKTPVAAVYYWILALLTGVVTGSLSGLFGIGSTPFIQLGLMILLRMPLHTAAGTTMMVIVPISLAGGAGYYSIGYIDFNLLFAVVMGTMCGSYIGAKFTKRVPETWLKTCMVLTPMLGAAILLL